MINVNTEFNENILKFGRQIDLVISYDDFVLHGKDIVSCEKAFDGKIFSSVMQYVNIELEGYHEVKNKEINIKLGVSYNGGTLYYADFGNFIVDGDSVENVEETNSTKFSAYDYLIKSHKDYDSSDIVFPCTLKEYLNSICTKCSILYYPDDFPNCSQIIEDDPFENIVVTYRDVLDYIASASGRCIAIDNSYLEVKEYALTEINLDQYNLSSLKIGKRWGPVNSLVLAREPQEDNIYINDEDSILSNGLTEIRIADNYIIEPYRSLFINDLFDAVKNIAFYAFEAESYGYAVFQPWDMIKIIDISGNEYVSIVMSDHLTITTGIKETIQFDLPEITTSDYSKSTKKERHEKNASLYVDKKLNAISAKVTELNDAVDGNTSKLTQLELTANGISTKVISTENRLSDLEKDYYDLFIESSEGFILDLENSVQINLTARIFNGSEEIDAEGLLAYTWYLVSNDETFTVLGTGKSLTIDSSILNEKQKIYFECEVRSEGETFRLTDELGNILTDENGNTLVWY